MRRVLFAIVVLLISTCAFAWPRLHLGSRGFEVEALQHLLNAKGADVKKLFIYYLLLSLHDFLFDITH